MNNAPNPNPDPNPNEIVIKNEYDTHFAMYGIFVTTASSRNEAEKMCNDYVTKKVCELQKKLPAFLNFRDSMDEYAEHLNEPGDSPVGMFHSVRYQISGFFAVTAPNKQRAKEICNNTLKYCTNEIEKTLGSKLERTDYVEDVILELEDVGQ